MPHIQLETVTSCNAKCPFCPHHMLTLSGRKYNTMSMELFKKLMDEVKTIPQIEFIYLVGLGETLLDPKLIERVKYIRGQGMENVIGMFTNGFLLTPAKLDELYEAGVTQIHVSLNATSPENHEEAMGVKGKYQHVVDMCHYGLKKWGLKRLQVTSIPTKGFDPIEYFRVWGESGIIWREDNFIGDTVSASKPMQFCDFPQTQINIMWDGRVSTCCMDVTGKRVFGDVSRQTIREVFNSEGYTRFRENHSLGKGKGEHPCDKCSRI